MVDRFCGLVEETVRPNLRKLVDPNSFEPSFHIDCRHICADFRENIAFSFSLSVPNLMARFLGTKPNFSGFSTHPSALPSTGRGDGASMGELTARASNGGGTLLPLLLTTFPSVMSRSMVGSIIVGGIVVKATGWRVLGVCGAVYAGLYVYERLAWTNKAKVGELFKISKSIFLALCA